MGQCLVGVTWPMNKLTPHLWSPAQDRQKVELLTAPQRREAHAALPFVRGWLPTVKVAGVMCSSGAAIPKLPELQQITVCLCSSGGPVQTPCHSQGRHECRRGLTGKGTERDRGHEKG